MRNKFITLEGLDASGKTTAVSTVKRFLRGRGITNIVTTHEPGGTPISNKLRMLIKYGLMDEPINNITELLMIYAARTQLIENIIKPALSKGYWVIGDRYDLSSQAYQGGGRKVDALLLRTLSRKIIKNLSPDLILYLDIPPEVSVLRIKNRGILDRIEQESLFFFNCVRARYLKLATLSENVVTIDATCSLKEVSVAIYKHLNCQLFNDISE